MSYLSLVLSFGFWYPDVVFIDGVSAPILLLRLARLPVLFYCHFPDKLLCVNRSSSLKRFYRRPLDWIEQYTTGLASIVAVNSEFTSAVFKEAFPQLSLNDQNNLHVLYPPINFERYRYPDGKSKVSPKTSGGGCKFCSINRFERKKNLSLAIEALSIVHKNMKKKEKGANKAGIERERKVLLDEPYLPRLIITGGYDQRVRENLEYLEELKRLTATLGLERHVSFIPNASDQDRARLLHESTCILYTPDREHFGIVPVEAMHSGTPVIAVSSGGPLETVLHRKTGFLCKNTPDDFASAMFEFVQNPNLASSMSDACYNHVVSKFSLEEFGKKLHDSLKLAIEICALSCSESLIAIAGLPLTICIIALYILY